MITPRRTRLLRVRDLQGFRDAIVAVARPADAGAPGRSSDSDPHGLPSRLVIVPHAAAAEQLRRSFQHRGVKSESIALMDFIAREELYDRLHARLADPPRRLSPYERDVIAQAAAREAASELGVRPVFQLRPGLVAEMLRFYDQLRRQTQQVARFEQLLEEALERDVELDRGADRMLKQTRLLASTFRAYEGHVAQSGACDEHGLRERLIADPSPSPARAVTVTVADWIADPHGLYIADFDLLTRLPGLETIDLVATEAVLASGFHQRIHDWFPGLEEIDFSSDGVNPRPMLTVAANTPDRPWLLSRDREEELIGIARRLKADRREKSRAAVEAPALDRAGVVYRRPLPYLYLAREVLGGGGHSVPDLRHAAAGG